MLERKTNIIQQLSVTFQTPSILLQSLINLKNINSSNTQESRQNSNITKQLTVATLQNLLYYKPQSTKRLTQQIAIPPSLKTNTNIIKQLTIVTLKQLTLQNRL